MNKISDADDNCEQLEQKPDSFDEKFICVTTKENVKRVFCCDWREKPSDAVKQLLDSGDYIEAYELVKDSDVHKQIQRDFMAYCNNSGLNNHYEYPGIYIDYTFHRDPTQCKCSFVFPWVICEWKGDTTLIPRPQKDSDIVFKDTETNR